MKREWGENSPIYVKKAAGFFSRPPLNVKKAARVLAGGLWLAYLRRRHGLSKVHMHAYLDYLERTDNTKNGKEAIAILRRFVDSKPGA